MRRPSWALVFRLLVASAGLGFIAWSMTWTDQVTLPPGWTLPDGQVLEEPARARVLARPGVDEAAQRWRVAMLGEHAGRELTLPRDAVGPGPAQASFEPGIFTTLGHARAGWLLAGLLLMGVVPPAQGWRWLMLMRSQGLQAGFVRALRLTVVGYFFNFCLPGMTGGDVVKGYYAAKGSGRQTEAVMSVVFDRSAGMFALVMLAALASLPLLWDAELWRLSVGAWALTAALVAGASVYLSRRLRRGVGLDALLGRLSEGNLLRRIDAAALAYRDRAGAVWLAVGVSLPALFCQVLATALAGWALGMESSAALLLTVLPLVYVAGAAPISYQGLGVMEALALGVLLEPGVASANQIVAMLMIARLYLLAYALPGAWIVSRGQMRLFPAGA